MLCMYVFMVDVPGFVPDDIDAISALFAVPGIGLGARVGKKVAEAAGSLVRWLRRVPRKRAGSRAAVGLGVEQSQRQRLEPPPGRTVLGRPPQTGSGKYTGPADEAYEAIRASKTDVAEIARHTGLKPSNIQKVKDHLFHNEYVLDRFADLDSDITVGRFDSDLGTAKAWARLRSGTHTPADMQMLRHEAAEAWYMRRHGPSYRAGHDAAERRYPFPNLEGDFNAGDQER